MSQQKDGIGRASASRRNDDITGMPTTPHPTIWQYTSRHYKAESSLSALSLVAADSGARARTIDELDTQPPRTQICPQGGNEIPTVIVPRVRAAQTGRLRLQADQPTRPAERGRNAFRAPTAAQPERKRGSARLGRGPFESLRWWLLYPGRIEFLLWIMGAMLLISLSIILLPLTYFSLAVPGADQVSAVSRQGSPAADTTVTSLCEAAQQGHPACTAIHVTSHSGLEITLLNNGQEQSGAPLQLHGRGFTALSQVSFTCDTHWQCRPASLRVDAHGNFVAKLMPADETSWTPGWHQVIVHDMVTQQSVSLPFTLINARTAT